MFAALIENPHEKFGGGIENLWGVLPARRRSDMTFETHEGSETVEATQGGANLSKDVECGELRGHGALLFRELRADTASPSQLPVLDWELPGEVEKASGHSPGPVVPGWRRWIGYHQAKVQKSLFDTHGRPFELSIKDLQAACTSCGSRAMRCLTLSARPTDHDSPIRRQFMRGKKPSRWPNSPESNVMRSMVRALASRPASM